MDLIERLEKASEGNRELDIEIQQTCVPGSVIEGFWPAMAPENAPHYTTSLDAALSLVAEGTEWQCGWGNRVLVTECAFAILDYRKLPKESRDEAVCHAPTPALALCIAALRARQSHEAR